MHLASARLRVLACKCDWLYDASLLLCAKPTVARATWLLAPRRAALDAQRERETAGVAKEARQLQSRRHGHGPGGGSSGGSSRQRSYSPEAVEQEEEEEYDDKLE